MNNHYPLKQNFTIFSSPPPPTITDTVLKPNPTTQKPNNLKIFSPPTITPALSPFTSPILPIPLSPFILSPPIITPNTTTTHQNAYLKRLQKNPIFKNLQNLLTQKYLHIQIPTNLIDSNLNNSTIKSKPYQLFPKHIKLQKKFLTLKTIKSLRSNELNLKSTYNKKIKQIEISRYQTLYTTKISNQHRKIINHHHNQRRLNLINQYETILQQILNTKKLKKNTKPISNPIKNKPLLTSNKKIIKITFPHKTTVQITKQLTFSSNNNLYTKRPNSPNSVYKITNSPKYLKINFNQKNLSKKKTNSNIYKTQTILKNSEIYKNNTNSYNSNNNESHSKTTNYHQNVTPYIKNLPISTSNSILQPFNTNKHTKLLNKNNIFKKNTNFQNNKYKKKTIKNNIKNNSISTNKPPNKKKKNLKLNNKNYLKKQIITSTNRKKKITTESTFILSK